MSNRTCFLYYKDWAELLLKMPEDLRLRIDDAIKRYVLFAEEPTDKEVLFSMFGIMRQQIDRDDRRYSEICRKNRDNIDKRWSRIDTAEYERIRPNTNYTDKDKVKDKDKNKKESTIVPKKSISLPKSIEDRRKDFENSVRPYLDQYGQELCTEFCGYWTEPNKNNSKMRFELQKTWEVGRRLSTWKRNQERRTV